LFVGSLFGCYLLLNGFQDDELRNDPPESDTQLLTLTRFFFWEPHRQSANGSRAVMLVASK
jgi:hypothetical protein